MTKSSYQLLVSALKGGCFRRVEVVSLRGMSLKQQITLMANTGVLIGSHGLGLTHVLWLGQWPRLLVEIFPPDSYMNDYQLLGACAGARHFAWDARHGFWHGSQYLLSSVCPPETYIPYGNVKVKNYELEDPRSLAHAVVRFSVQSPRELALTDVGQRNGSSAVPRTCSGRDRQRRRKIGRHS